MRSHQRIECITHYAHILNPSIRPIKVVISIHPLTILLEASLLPDPYPKIHAKQLSETNFFHHFESYGSFPPFRLKAGPPPMFHLVFDFVKVRVINSTNF
ncbi:hypothetical protein Hanom_Chr08g00733991 [Helianthus anomalus]